jgi:hypothetical protein
MGNLRQIEANPGGKSLQAEFLARRDILWGRMTTADQQVVYQEHGRVRDAIKDGKEFVEGAEACDACG